MKRLLAVILMVSALMIPSGCGADQKEDTGAQAPEEQQLTITGTMDGIKDFMFVLTDEDGASYGFDFTETPEGLDEVAVGDTVTVTYTGEISMVDPFEGTIISVEPAE